MTDIEWPTGGLWEGYVVTIQTDVRMSRTDHPRSGFVLPCPHAKDVTRAPHRYACVAPAPFDAELVQWAVPHVVVAWNEAGHDTTGVCADCVADAVASL